MQSMQVNQDTTTNNRIYLLETISIIKEKVL